MPIYIINKNDFFEDNDDKCSAVSSACGTNETQLPTALEVASFIIDQYYTEFNEKIDEMKLHKLLYFVQRESLADTGTVAFNDEFRAWKYGPVVLSVRDAYKSWSFPKVFQIANILKEIIKKVFVDYAQRSSWSLSDATHRELSWRNARKGIPDGENGNNIMELSDIKKDAERLQYTRARDAIRRIIDGAY